MPWADLYAKLQVSVPAGEGPDLALIHTVEVPHFASDGVLEAIDDAHARRQGLPRRGLPAGDLAGRHLPGQALLAAARRAAAHALPEREGDEGGRPGRRRRQAEGARQPRRAGDHGQADDEGRHASASPSARSIPAGTRGASTTCSGRTAPTSTRRDLKRAALAEPAALEVAEFWAALPRQHKVAPPANANCRDAFIAGKLGMWIAGSWNFTGLREAKVDFTAAPVPRLFKQPVVWSMPHQYASPSRRPPTAREARRGVDARALDDRPRRRVDAEGRPGLGQPQGAQRSAHHRRSGPQDAARPGAELAGRPGHAEVGRGREPHAAGDRDRLHGSEAAQGGDGGPGAADQRAAGVAT